MKTVTFIHGAIERGKLVPLYRKWGIRVILSDALQIDLVMPVISLYFNVAENDDSIERKMTGWYWFRFHLYIFRNLLNISVSLPLGKWRGARSFSDAFPIRGEA
jgi:hypothetical protein